MMRIALLGNSHVANWKRAWNSLGRAYPEVELVFFAAPGQRLECCEPQGDRLVFTSEDVSRWVEITSGGRRELVPADYDALCVVGLGFGMKSVTGLHSRWRADSHKGTEGRFRLVSDACFQDAVDDLLKGSLAMTVVGSLRRITDEVIWLAPQPALSEIVLTSDNAPGGNKFAAAATDALSLRAAYEEACRRLGVENLIVLEQPKATLASPVLSKDEYRRPSETTPDYSHLNDAYGEIAIREFLSHLDPSLEGRDAGETSDRLVRPVGTLLAALRSRFSQISVRRSSKS